MSTIKEIAAKVANTADIATGSRPVVENFDHLATFIEQGIEAYIAEQKAPDFQPEGVPDIYRDAWESLTNEETGPDWIGSRVGDLAPFSLDLARRILVMLSVEAATLALKGKVN